MLHAAAAIPPMAARLKGRVREVRKSEVALVEA
jgi:hypothetical protein